MNGNNKHSELIWRLTGKSYYPQWYQTQTYTYALWPTASNYTSKSCASISESRNTSNRIKSTFATKCLGWVEEHYVLQFVSPTYARSTRICILSICLYIARMKCHAYITRCLSLKICDKDDQKWLRQLSYLTRFTVWKSKYLNLQLPARHKKLLL